MHFHSTLPFPPFQGIKEYSEMDYMNAMDKILRANNSKHIECNLWYSVLTKVNKRLDKPDSDPTSESD